MKALILLDLQNDFLPPAGALAVPRGDELIPIANQLAPRFELVVATQDWHPADHESFAFTHPGRKPGELIDLHGLPQVLWPAHCVENTAGAALAPGLDTARIMKVFQKGADRTVDSYSGFFDNGHRHATGLERYLKNAGVDQLVLAGLATDYCVKFTALDALALGFETSVLYDACRAVNLRPGDEDRALAELRHAGVTVCDSVRYLS